MWNLQGNLTSGWVMLFDSPRLVVIVRFFQDHPSLSLHWDSGTKRGNPDVQSEHFNSLYFCVVTLHGPDFSSGLGRAVYAKFAG